MGRFLAGKSQSCARPQACHIKATLNPKLHPLKSPVPYAPKHSALVEVWMLSHRSDTRLPGSGHPHVLPESHGASSPLLLTHGRAAKPPPGQQTQTGLLLPQLPPSQQSDQNPHSPAITGSVPLSRRSPA